MQVSGYHRSREVDVHAGIAAPRIFVEDVGPAGSNCASSVMMASHELRPAACSDRVPRQMPILFQ